MSLVSIHLFNRPARFRPRRKCSRDKKNPLNEISFMSHEHVSHRVKCISKVETSFYLLCATKKESLIDSEDDGYPIDQEEADEEDFSFMIATSDNSFDERFSQVE
jgi:hypothetical protein